MTPPLKLNPLCDRNGGFTALMRNGDTLWRPGRLAKDGAEATLVKYDERSFYQRNNNVTMATYRLKGYGYPVLAWFDNGTGERIA